jgi:hypothetical protein
VQIITKFVRTRWAAIDDTTDFITDLQPANQLICSEAIASGFRQRHRLVIRKVLDPSGIIVRDSILRRPPFDLLSDSTPTAIRTPILIVRACRPQHGQRSQFRHPRFRLRKSSVVPRHEAIEGAIAKAFNLFNELIFPA